MLLSDSMYKNSDGVNGESTIEPNRNWPQIPDHAYRILIFDGSGSGKKSFTSFDNPPTRY